MGPVALVNMSSEEVSCNEDSKSREITDTTQTKDVPTSAAQIQLDELNDILKEYADDETSVDEVGSSQSLSDEARRASPGADDKTSHGVEPTVFSDSPHIVEEPQKQSESPENSDASDQCDETVTLFSLPNGYSFDITNPVDCKELVKFCEGLLERTKDLLEKSEKREHDVNEKDVRIGKMNVSVVFIIICLLVFPDYLYRSS